MHKESTVISFFLAAVLLTMSNSLFAQQAPGKWLRKADQFFREKEYGKAIESGVNVLTDDFFMFYFMLTGIHLSHVLVGITLLIATRNHIKGLASLDGSVSFSLVGFSSNFWHMLDLVWILLFPLLYLLK